MNLDVPNQHSPRQPILKRPVYIKICKGLHKEMRALAIKRDLKISDLYEEAVEHFLEKVAAS